MNACTLALAGACLLAGPDLQSHADTPPTESAKTEDVLHMSDGRVLHGQILSETRDQVVFEYRDPNLKMVTKLTLNKDDIAQIERDLPLAQPEPSETPEAPEKPASTPAPSASGKKKSLAAEAAATSRMLSTNPNVASFYLVPMHGQMSTDVNSSAYADVVKDIKAKKPDVVVIQMNCEDVQDTLYTLLGNFEPEEVGVLDFDEMRKLVTLFQKDLREFRQVLWVHNSVGISTNAALSWKELYMTPSARLGGMASVLSQSGAKNWQDSDVRAKMMAAWTGISKSFLEFSGRSHALGDAMLDPEYTLSVSWKGRDAIWALNTEGEYVVDSSDELSTNFYAKHAEDFRVSEGTAETLDDLALLLGYREYRIIDGEGERIIESYVEDWRRRYEDCKTQAMDYQKFLGWANGDDTVKYLGRAKGCLEDILAAVERYKAIEIRMAREFGASRTNLRVLIEQLQEQLRALRSNGRSVGGGSGGGGRGSGMGGG